MNAYDVIGTEWNGCVVCNQSKGNVGIRSIPFSSRHEPK